MADNTETLAAYGFADQAARLRGWRSSLAEDVSQEVQRLHPGLLDRVQAVANLFTIVTITADPDLVPPTVAGGTQGQATTVLENLAQVASGAFEPYLSHLSNDYLPALISALNAWPRLPLKTEEEVTRIAEAFRRSTEKALSDMRAEIVGLRSDVGAREAEVTEAKSELERLRQELQVLREATDAQRATLDSVGANAQTSFAAQEAAQSKEFTAALAEMKATAISDLGTLHDGFETRMKQDETAAQGIIDEIERKKVEAEGLVSIIGTVGTAGYYQNEANSQKESADRWRWIAVALSLVAIGIAIYIIASHDSATSGEMVGKIVAAISAGGIAAYAAKQSGDHRRREERARQTELELVAFGPFVEGLDEGERLALRKEVAKRLFVDGVSVEVGEGTASLNKDQISLFQQAVEVLNGIRR